MWNEIKELENFKFIFTGMEHFVATDEPCPHLWLNLKLYLLKKGGKKSEQNWGSWFVIKVKTEDSYVWFNAALKCMWGKLMCCFLY